VGVGRLARDPVAGGGAVVFALLVLWFAAGGGGDRADVLAYGVGQWLSDISVAVIAARIQRGTSYGPARWFWRAVSAAFLVFLVSDTLFVVGALRAGEAIALFEGTAPAIGYAVGAALPLIAILVYPTGTQAGARLRYWLDAGTVLLAAGMFAWCLTISPVLASRQPGRLVQATVTAALVVTATFGLTKLLLSGRGPATRAATLVACVATAGQAITDSVIAVTPAGPGLLALLGARMVPAYLIVVALRIQQLSTTAPSPVPERRPGRRFSLLPYVSVAATFGMLAVVLPADLGVQAVGALVFVALVSITVVVRQLLAFVDNAGLLDRLDASMARLSRHEQRFRVLLEHSSDIIMVIGVDGRLRYVSPAVHTVLGVPAEDAVGRSWRSWVHPGDAAGAGPVMERLLAAPRATATYQVRVRHTDGEWRWLDVVFTNHLDDPEVGGVVGNGREVTEARRLQDRLRHQVAHDGLTGLPNRTLFGERLAEAQVQGPTIAVVLIDLDGFKEINDTLGHHVGDATLVAVAQRLQACVRTEDTAARLGGDEFAVLVPGGTEDVARELGERFTAMLSDPIAAAGHRVRVGASVGVAAGPAADQQRLLRLADAAMYRVKHDRRAVHDETPGPRELPAVRPAA
jgi:diguanylate cyclase (GGDEF)-like protein/PAS domain S-box-containing protein